MKLLVFSYADAAGLNIMDSLDSIARFEMIIPRAESTGPIRDNDEEFSRDAAVPDFKAAPLNRGFCSLSMNPVLDAVACGTDGSLLYLDEPGECLARFLVEKEDEFARAFLSGPKDSSPGLPRLNLLGQLRSGKTPEMVIFLSRHKSVSNARTLTVHHVGNFGKADFGGVPGKLGSSNPAVSSQLLRNLKREGTALGLDYGITFEATHHGPTVSIPACFIEIGSLDEQWRDPIAGKAVASAVFSLLSDLAPGEQVPEWCSYPYLIGIGGSHYCPRFSDVVAERKVNFGHISAGYNDPVYSIEIFTMMMDFPGCAGAYIHKKGFGKPRAREIVAMCEGAGLKVPSSEDYQPIKPIPQGERQADQAD